MGVLCDCEVVACAYLYAIIEHMGCGNNLTRCHVYSGRAASSIVLMLVLQQSILSSQSIYFTEAMSWCVVKMLT